MKTEKQIALKAMEQGSRDINKAQAITLYRLAKALDCNIEELLDLKD